MLVLAVILILVSLLFVTIAGNIKSVLYSALLVIGAGLIFSLATMYGTTHRIETDQALVQGYRVHFGWPIRYAVQSDRSVPLSNGATISFRVGGGVASHIDKAKMYLNALIYIVLFGVITMVRRKRIKHA